MKGYFDEAVNNNEITAYLNGEGEYFRQRNLTWDIIIISLILRE